MVVRLSGISFWGIKHCVWHNVCRAFCLVEEVKLWMRWFWENDLRHPWRNKDHTLLPVLVLCHYRWILGSFMEHTGRQGMLVVHRWKTVIPIVICVDWDSHYKPRRGSHNAWCAPSIQHYSVALFCWRCVCLLLKSGGWRKVHGPATCTWNCRTVNFEGLFLAQDVCRTETASSGL